MWLSSIEHIVWDLDGTLYPHSPALWEEIEGRKIRAVAEKLGCSLEEADAEFSKIFSEEKSNTKTLNFFGIDGEGFFLDTWDELDFSRYIFPNPQLSEHFFDKRWKHSILTNSNRMGHVKKKLDCIGITSNVFEYVFTSVETGYVKPDQAAFLQVLNNIHLQPEHILLVGDREKVDIVPAKKLGMKTCLIGRSGDTADIQVETPLEVFLLLKDSLER